MGPQVGRLLLVLARSIEARRVLEMGSGFGYSAYWFCHAVGAEGEVTLTEGSAERAADAARFLREGGLLDRSKIEVGDAFVLLDFRDQVGGLVGAEDHFRPVTLEKPLYLVRL